MTVGYGIISGFSVAHGHADLDTIELACTTRDTSVVESLLEHASVTEAVCLQTCNRSEAYVVTESPKDGHDALSSVVRDVPSDAVRELGHEESLRHLMRVSCGLESIVLGEDQILGQLREAYLSARSMDAIGPMLEEALTKALHVGERARTETEINEGVVSLGSAAVRLAARDIDLDDASALVVGAGEMGTIAASSLAAEADQLVIANRTIPHAEHIAGTIDGAEAIGLEALPSALAESDVVVSATGSDSTVIDSSMLEEAAQRSSSISPSRAISLLM
ncbi:glutamyl-tRNA reductase [Halocatena marina]|uniref:glutamyl-tRNA reductase n=1 Tax=Halocatena marina TaxID=2934937 RepID=UPI0036208813